MAKATARMTTSGPPFPLNELTTAPWREQALTKIGEQRFVLEWMAQADGAQPISSGSLRPHTSSARFRRSLKRSRSACGRRHAPRATPTARGGLTAHCASAPPDRPSARRRTTAIPGAGIERGAAGQPTTISRARVDAAMRSAASGWDIAVVLGVGLLAAALAAAASLRWIHGTSTPFGLPVALALRELPTGALTAVLGLILMRGQFVPGLSALDSSGQIVSWGSSSGTRGSS